MKTNELTIISEAIATISVTTNTDLAECISALVDTVIVEEDAREIWEYLTDE